jgi:hypothetical protein
MLWCRCLYCDGGFMADRDTDVCPQCESRVRGEYKNDPTPDYDSPWKLSKPVMRERLSVSGNKDE